MFENLKSVNGYVYDQVLVYIHVLRSDSKHSEKMHSDLMFFKGYIKALYHSSLISLHEYQFLDDLGMQIARGRSFRLAWGWSSCSAGSWKGAVSNA